MKTQKNVSVVVEDFVEELIDENKRLFTELKFCDKLIKYLFELKSVFDLNRDKLRKTFDLKDWTELMDISRNINTLVPLMDSSVQLLKSQQGDSHHGEEVDACEKDPCNDDHGQHDDGEPLKACHPVVNNTEDDDKNFKCFYQDFDQTVRIKVKLPTKAINPSHEEGKDQKINKQDNTSMMDIDQGEVKQKSDNDQFQCTQCERSFATNQSLSLHKVNDHTTDHKCVHCGRHYSSRGVLTKHVKNVHGPRPFRCSHPGCKFSASRKSDLTTHSFVHSDDRPIVCPVYGCGKTFKSTFALRYHSRCHSDERPFRCEVEGCHKSYKIAHDLSVHQAQTHHMGKQLSCDWPGCDYTTYSTQVLRQHQVVHQDLQFICDHQGCGKVFKRKQNFITHQLGKHQDKPARYSCTWPGCQFAVHIKASLRQHELSHSKPFTCDWPGCEFKTARPYRLKEHQSKSGHSLDSGAVSAPMDQIMANNVVAKVEVNSELKYSDFKNK